MNRREFMKAVGASALLMPAAARALGPNDRDLGPQGLLCGKSGSRPNVILILCDDLGWGDLGCYGQKDREAAGKPHIDTPALDAMAAEGVQFMHAYTTAPVCAPARASMVTGKHQGHCNLRSNMFDRPVDAHMTLGTVMKQAGYATWHLGKWGIGGGYESGGQPRRAMACDAGFDYSYCYPAHLHGHTYYHYESDWNAASGASPIVDAVSKSVYDDETQRNRYAGLSAGSEHEHGIFERDPEGTYYRRLVSDDEVQFCYDVDLFTAKLKQLILSQQEVAPEQPFFAYACYTTVHGSHATRLDPDVRLRQHMHIPPAAYPALDDGDRVWGGGVTFAKDDAGHLNCRGTADTANTYIYPEYAEYPTWGQQRYATAVRRLDEAIADLRHFLKIRGLSDRTLIVFTSDNGPAGEALPNAAGNGETGALDWVENGLDSNAHLKGMKRWSYEGGVREPTLAVWPGVTDALAEHRTDLPMQFPAWMATLADLAGLPQPAHCDGVSVLPTLSGSGKQLPMRIYTEYSDGGSGQSFGFEQIVREGRYVLIRNHGAGGTAELYDVANDPSQTVNLAGQAAHAERVRYMTGLLTACRIPPAQVPNACGAPGVYSQSPDAVNALAYPAYPAAGPLPPAEARLYFRGAEAWPWVPNFRTLLPEEGFLAGGAEALRAKLAERAAGRQAYGLSLRGWIEAEAEGEVAFSAAGAGGCQLWIHEAHILEYEAGGCAAGRTAALKLAKGRHPFRLYLTTADGADGLCSVSAGGVRLS